MSVPARHVSPGREKRRNRSVGWLEPKTAREAERALWAARTNKPREGPGDVQANGTSEDRMPVWKKVVVGFMLGVAALIGLLVLFLWSVQDLTVPM